MLLRIFTRMVILMCTVSVFSCKKKSETPGSGGQAPAMTSQKTAGLDAIIPAGAVLEKVTAGYEFDTAGSPLYVDGELYFTNNNFDPADKSCTIKMDAAGQYHVLRKDNGVTTTLQLSGKGTLYACEMLGHRVIEMGLDGSVLRVVAGEYAGKRIDGPNDLCVDHKGGIYFTDSQFIGNEQKMQDKPAVYYVNQLVVSRSEERVSRGKPTVEKYEPTKTMLQTTRVIDDVEFPNGVWLSPDEKTLYLCNTRQRYLLAYDVNPDGTVANGRNFAELQLNREVIGPDSEESGADGIVADSAGNIFVATTKMLGIQVFDSTGRRLGNIPCAASTNNAKFGGPDMKTLYVSAKDGIYKIPVKIPGMRVPQK